jgi:flavodoxin short chain
MKKALIIFGTTTGNTETMAESIEKALNEQLIETEIKNVVNVSINDLTAEHDLLLLGCPAYGDEEIELQEDFAEFYEKLDGLNLNGKKFAVFAPGDSSYEYFCGSVDFLEEKMLDLGGEMVTTGLKVDGDPDDYIDDIEEWSSELVKGI